MSGSFQLNIVSPDKILLSEPVTMAVIPGAEGDFGVLADHAPFMSSLRPGVVEIHKGNSAEPQKIFVFGGIASVENNHCTVLADRATPLSEIKRDEFVSAIEKIRQRIAQGEDTEQLRRELNGYQTILQNAV